MTQTHRSSFCGSPEHVLDRRGFIGSLTAGAAAVAGDGPRLPREPIAAEFVARAIADPHAIAADRR